MHVQKTLPPYDNDSKEAQHFWESMLDHICAPLQPASIMGRLTKGPDLDQLPEPIWEKVQAGDLLNQEERQIADTRVIPIRRAMQTIMKKVLVDFLISARLDLIGANLGLSILYWGPPIPQTDLNHSQHEDFEVTR